MTRKNKKQGIPFIALVGRVNVGKSTLFNRLLGVKKALASPKPGTTRDVNYGVCSWREHQFFLADTGGFILHPQTEIEKAIYSHAKAAIQRALLILFIADAQEGLNPSDRDYIRLIRKWSKACVMLIANKADSERERLAIHEREWLTLGLGSPIPVSAISGSGTGDLLDTICDALPKKQEQKQEERNAIKVSIIGRTNVGKSSLLNRVLGEERVIVSSIPHTTREPHDTLVEYQDRKILLIDTVGIRRKTRVSSLVEREGVKRSIDNIRKSDIVLFVLESTVTPSKQEKRLIDLCIESGVSICIIVNKWDLVKEKESKTVLVYEELFRDYFPFLSWAPMVFLSALTGQRIHTVYDIILTLQEERNKEISDETLKEFLRKALARQKPQWIRGQKKPFIYALRQEGVAPPRFEVIVQDRFSIPVSYLRYLENRLREQYCFNGTPMILYTTQRKTHVQTGKHGKKR